MVAPPDHRQRIARLTPLDDVLRRIGQCVDPVTPREMRTAAALGATLAQDIAVAAPHPAAPLALIDGWAVRAEATADAAAYAPVILPHTREVAEKHFGHLPADVIHRIVRGNAIRLFDLDLHEPDPRAETL